MISGSMLKNAIISGSNLIAKHKRAINDLNIFPVPDGDTGTNMSMTISAASEALNACNDAKNASEVAELVSSAMLRGARGNSGVILSLLFRGLAKGIGEKEEIDAETLVSALDLGVSEAYEAVMKPTEGTILTVARVAAEKAREALSVETDPVLIWDAVCAGANAALDTTPDLLPILKKAGVVDAGGQGLCLIFEGMMHSFKHGGILPAVLSVEALEEEADSFFKSAAAEFDGVINFTYCTEFIVERNPDLIKDPIDLRLFLETIGDSVVVVDDSNIIKTHVHTEDPGLALQEALQYGQLVMVKVENMKEQHKQAAKARAPQSAKVEEAKSELMSLEPAEQFGFVSVAAGSGVKTLFEDLGCTHVVSGGQTMNPSTEDLLEAVMATPAKTVFILPNNKNIILAAEQTIPLVQDRTVIVIPTKTIPQGLSAMLAFDAEADIERNTEKMQSAANAVDTGLVTFAARNAEFGGHNIHEGDILGMVNGKLTFVERDISTTCLRVAKSLIKKDTSFLTLIYGNGITEHQAEELKQVILAKSRGNYEVNLVNGKQPLYYYILSVE